MNAPDPSVRSAAAVGGRRPFPGAGRVVEAVAARGGDWIAGNHVKLLANGEQFYPRVFAAIESARREVLIETFILFDDRVGAELKRVLLAAAARGVRIDLTIDGWGSAFLPQVFCDELTSAGVCLHVFDPGKKIFHWRPNFLRRMHRKITVIDDRLAFVGGINFSHDHLADFGPEAKEDCAVEIEGPIVTTIGTFARGAVHRAQPDRGWLRRIHAQALSSEPDGAGAAQVMLVTRDNRWHRNDIELHYRTAIRLARRRVVIANAYFFPGYRLLRDLVAAARRGVEVRLLLQGEPDIAIARSAPALLHSYLLRAGIRIHEYVERPYHGKVAVVDDEWATIGSSNLDPLSLSLNLEANVMIRDRGFNAALAERLEQLISEQCREVRADELPVSRPWHALRSAIVFHFLRHFPRWAHGLPRHRPRVRSLRASDSTEVA